MSELGDQIQLANQQVMVEKCKECGEKMVNVDANQLAKGDLVTLKNAGVRISNPETKDPVCLSCHVDKKHKFWQGVNDFFEGGSDTSDASDKEDDDDDDSHFFGGGISTGGFGGGESETV